MYALCKNSGAFDLLLAVDSLHFHLVTRTCFTVLSVAGLRGRVSSVIKMATFLEYTIEEQRSVVLFFCGQKDSMQRIFIKKCFLFTVGSACRVKRFTTGWQTFR
jgi:hypothetical protein